MQNGNSCYNTRPGLAVRLCCAPAIGLPVGYQSLGLGGSQGDSHRAGTFKGPPGRPLRTKGSRCRGDHMSSSRVPVLASGASLHADE